MDDKRRNVYKIHGSIENIGTLVITEDDYEECYKNLSTNIFGSRIRYLLSNKTVVFIGYSLEDDDFKRIWKHIDDSLGNLKPHFYIISPDSSIKEKMRNRNITQINTIGSEFIKRIRQKLIEDDFILDSNILYPLSETLLELAFDIHKKTSQMYRDENNSLLIYSLIFQDGIIHSLQRILAKKKSGEYMNPSYLPGSIETYYRMFKDYIRKNNIIDATYVLGYAHAMDSIFYMYNCMYFNKEPIECNIISLYYLPREKMYNKLDDFINSLRSFNTKKYINFAEDLKEKIGCTNGELIIHHPPFL